ncbi:maleylpyruvate isomerase N-terminal domain-containing protein [Streptomyces diastatochromogenes]|nr:maleylpyruvate isomerase N-terminal domain-containing protein [Streptomyces diastatochromogenes]
MTDSPSMPTPDVDRLRGEVERSAARLAATLSGLTEAECRAPGALAPWTRGQVLAHIAGSADAYVWLLRLARTGSAPGPRQDAAALAETAERTAALPVDALADRTRRALDLVVAEAREMPAARWDVLVAALAGWRHPPGTPSCGACGSWSTTMSTSAWDTAPPTGRRRTCPGRSTRPSPPCGPRDIPSPASRRSTWAATGPRLPRAPRSPGPDTSCSAGSAGELRPRT